MEDLMQKFIERGTYSAPDQTDYLARIISGAIIKAGLYIWPYFFELAGAVCILATIIGIIMLMIKSKKGKNFIAGGIGAYIILSFLNSVIM